MDARQHWKYRAIEFAHATRTPLGLILCAACGQVPSRPPAMSLNARINLAGQVVVGYVDEAGRGFYKSLGLVDEFNGKFNRLADMLKFSDDERVELFDTLRQWIAVDERAMAEETIPIGERDR